MLTRAGVVLAFSLVFPGLLAAASGRVVAVAEGDVLTVQTEGGREEVRLYGIDAPDKGQRAFKHARLFATDLAMGKTVDISRHGKDDAGRTLGDVTLPDGRSLNEQIVRAGWAWWDYRQSPKDEDLKGWEEEARFKKRGFWREKNSAPPWEKK